MKLENKLGVLIHVLYFLIVFMQNVTLPNIQNLTERMAKLQVHLEQLMKNLK